MKLFSMGLTVILAAALFSTFAFSVSIPVSSEQNYGILSAAPSRRAALSNEQVLLYDALYAQMLKTDSSEITFRLDGIHPSIDSAAVIRALSLDFPELFAWVNRSVKPDVSITFSGTNSYQVTIRFEPLQSARGFGTQLNLSRLNQARQLADSIIVQGTLLESDAARVQFYHDTLCQLASYDVAAVTQVRSGDSSARGDSFEMTGVFLDGKGTAEGYALAMKYLCDHSMPPIPCLYAEGELTSSSQTPSGPHAWNYISFHDGWYLLDVVNDDTSGSNAPSSPRFYCIGSSNAYASGYQLSDTSLATLPLCTADWNGSEHTLDSILDGLLAEANAEPETTPAEPEPVVPAVPETTPQTTPSTPSAPVTSSGNARGQIPKTFAELESAAKNGVVTVSLSGESYLPGQTLEALSSAISISLNIQLNNSASLFFSGGASLRSDPRASYNITYRQPAASQSRILSYVSNARRSYTFSIGEAAMLPVRVTITVPVSAPDGTELDIYRYNNGAFTPIDSAVVKNGSLSFRTTLLGDFLLTDGSV